MTMKIFTDVINALGKAADMLRSIANLPKREREKMHQTLDETYRLLDTTLNMIIIRLGDILLLESDGEFLQEAAELDNFNGWMRSEREFRLCRSLRMALRETQTIAGKLAGRVSTNHWDALLEQMERILTTEHELAFFIR